MALWQEHTRDCGEHHARANPRSSGNKANTSHNESTVKAEVSARLAGTARLDRQHDAMECYNDFDDSQEHDFGTVLQKTYTTGPLRT